MSYDLPPPLRLAADRLMEGVSRKDMAQRAGAISRRYRGGGGSAGVVTSQADATAYVLTRLPATYAACARVFAEAADRAPGFAPDRKSTRLNSSHVKRSRMPSSA